MEMTLLSVLKWLLYLYLASSYKSLPGAYFFRFYAAIMPVLFFPYWTGKETKNVKQLANHKYGCFANTRLATYVSPFECDFYLHKSNSTYFEELDISRGELMSKIFQKLFLNSKRWPYIPVASVFTNFLKEIRPFEKYAVTSVILCWDKKWIYVLSRFTKNNDKILCSLSLTKYVLKDGRKTIPPQEALEFCGLHNEDAEKVSQRNLKMLTEQCGFHETLPLEELDHHFLEI